MLRLEQDSDSLRGACEVGSEDEEAESEVRGVSLGVDNGTPCTGRYQRGPTRFTSNVSRQRLVAKAMWYPTAASR
jgi:hypothetical protein